MKYLFFLLITFQLFSCENTFAQTGCLECCDESFPYKLCPGDTAGCWTSPSDGTQAKAHIPGKICLDTLPNNMQWMPKKTFDNSSFWLTDPGLSSTNPIEIQFNSDLDRIFIEQLEPIDLNPSNPSSHAKWMADRTQWIDTMNVYYKKIWDYNQAKADAQNALNQWLSLCTGLEKDTSCCLHINYATDDPKDSAKKAKFKIYITDYASTDLAPCGETDCSNRSLTINATEEGRFDVSNPKNALPDPRFGLIEVPFVAFWTGRTPPTGIVNNQYDSAHRLISWYELMEHEIGHYLGLWHPDHSGGANNGQTCNNNYSPGTPCHDGRFAIMLQGEIVPNGAPHGLQKDDSCMFKKLYCYSSLGCASGVKDMGASGNTFTPRLYPNPSTGVTFLSYTVSKKAKVEISLLDLLGKSIIGVVNSDQYEGDYTISLPTQYFAAGHYICRVVCGENEAELNIVIVK
jgi:hypothetical protein